MSTVFEAITCFHCLNIVYTEREQNRVSLKLRTDNSIRLVVYMVCYAWALLMSRAVDRALCVNLLPYLWYDRKFGCYIHLPPEAGLSPFIQHQSLIPSVRPIPLCGADVDDSATARTV